MKNKFIASILALFVFAFIPLLFNSCGSDDNNDFNIYFVGVGTNTDQNFYDYDPLQKIVSNDLSVLNQKWQTTIMNEKEALSEFDKFCVDLNNKLKTKISDGDLLIKGQTYFSLVLSHSVKSGQEYPVIATYKISLSASDS